MELAVLDEQGNEVAVGSPGEVCVRGANVTAGYKGNRAANAEAFMYGWFHTGDIGVRDGGYVRLVGRIKELVNRGGEKILPIEVDSVLLSHPDVAQAVAFGVPDDKYGEEIHCAVIPRDGVEMREEEVVAFCRRNLAAFKVPKKVYIGHDLPKTATGKIQRPLHPPPLVCVYDLAQEQVSIRSPHPLRPYLPPRRQPGRGRPARGKLAGGGCRRGSHRGALEKRRQEEEPRRDADWAAIEARWRNAGRRKRTEPVVAMGT